MLDQELVQLLAALHNFRMKQAMRASKRIHTLPHLFDFAADIFGVIEYHHRFHRILTFMSNYIFPVSC